MVSDKNRKKGFTLIELLVVISIIALLLSILMPSLARVRESANSTVCKTNLRQIMTAGMVWSQDRNGHVVAGMWHVPAVHPDYDNGSGSAIRQEATARGASLEPYTSSDAAKQKSLYTCPSVKKFGEDFYSISTSIYATAGKLRENTVAYGVNSFATLYTGDNYIGDKGAPGGAEAYYASWGRNNVYMLEHGKSKMEQISTPSSRVYFTDFSYPIVYDYMYGPLQVFFFSGGSYGSASTLSSVPAGARLVQARWHGTIDRQTGYGDSNIGWFDGSVSGEPTDFDDPTPIRTSGGGFGGGTNRYKWQRYFYR